MSSVTGRRKPRRSTNAHHRRAQARKRRIVTREPVMRGSSAFLSKLSLGVLLCAGAVTVHAEQDPLDDPSVQKTLRGMADASTWYHPDQFGEFAGMRHYAHHEYKSAMKYFD